MSELRTLTIDSLKAEAKSFAARLSADETASLYGVTDGKAIGTFVEQRFRAYLSERYFFTPGSSASGIDFPELAVDVKVTSAQQPQSSSPFQNAAQKVYGLGCGLLVVVYDKLDNPETQLARLMIQHLVFISSERTADYQTTRGIQEILDRDGNIEDVGAFLADRHLPLDEIGRDALARRILVEPPLLGYLTISNALQWRLQYGRAIKLAAEGSAAGLENLFA